MKYENLLKKKAENPEWWAERQKKILEGQRRRFQNPVVRERHRLSCIKAKERRALGLVGKMERAPHVPAGPVEYRDAPFHITFD